MNSDALRQLLQKAPFRPLRLHLADGRRLDVPHPDFIFLFHREPRAMIEKPDGGVEWVNLPIVVSVEILEATDAA
ncbi:MAG TPA: hypothetical protein VFE31_14755 [Opitutaceae bacterium]|jgi:hypothetical protein|nr:hypothetical protein [Opitutaceae bacterium]